LEKRQKVGRPASKRSDFIFGMRAVQEALDAGRNIEKVLVQSDLRNDWIRQLIAQLKDLGIPYSQVPGGKLQRITRKNHQGVVCFISSVQYHSLDHVIESAYQKGKEPLLVILDRVTDVRNFGAIARTMECAGADAIVVPAKGNAMIGGDAMKTSAGALNHLSVCRESNLKDAIVDLKNRGLRLVASTEKATGSLYTCDLTGPIAIVMGSEEDGISSEYLKLCDERLHIPLHGKIESLNVSVAAGIMLYEVIRQRMVIDRR
jgi:23S rRNA (guanosine2251-2'-O)-methyltransferase